MSKCKECGKPTREQWHNYCDEHFRPQRNPSTRKSSDSRGLPLNYLKQGYFDEKGNLRSELIGEQAKYIALELHRFQRPGIVREVAATGRRRVGAGLHEGVSAFAYLLLFFR